MAKTQAQWKSILETAKGAYSTLSALTSGAWQSWLNICAYVTLLLENTWEDQKVVINQAAQDIQQHTKNTIRQALLDYQEGDEPILVGNKWTYPVIDEDKKIIKAAVVYSGASSQASNDNNIIFHVAIVDANGDYSATIPTDGYVYYMTKVRAFGAATSSSNGADPVANFAVEATVYYDPSILASDGSLLSDSTVFPVVNAIRDYQDIFVNVEGILRNQELIDYIKGATGVVGGALTNQKYDKAGGTSYSNVSREFVINQVSQYLIAGASQLTYTSV